MLQSIRIDLQLRPLTQLFQPILPAERNTLKTCIFTAISNVFWLWWGFVQGHVPHIWAFLGPNFGTTCQITHVKPNLRPTPPKLRPVGPQLGPSWAEVGANWPEFRRKLGPSWLLYGPTYSQGRLSLIPVGFWLGQVGPLLSSLSFSLSAGGTRREATPVRVYIYICIYIYMYVCR